MRDDLCVAAACALLAMGVGVGAQSGQRSLQAPRSDVRATGTAALSGVVVDAGTGRPVSGALVTLVRGPREPVGRQNRQIADSQGRFVFVDLPAGGGYALVGSKPGYLTTRADGPGAISLADGEWIDTAHVWLRKTGAITGTVADERNEPVAGVEVRALAVISIAGSDHLAMGPTTTTDDRGRYRVGNLLPGRYRIVVPSLQASVSQWSTPASVSGRGMRLPGAGVVPGSDDSAIPVLDVPGNLRVALGRYPVPPPPDANGQALAYPPTFHPGTPMLGAASIIEVRSGSDATADVQIRALPAGVVRGLVEGPGPVANLLVRLLSHPDLGIGLETGTARTDVSGAFTFVNVPAGDYVIDVPVNVSEYEYRAVDGPALPTRPEATVRDDWTFEIPNIAPGTFDLTGRLPAGGNWWLRSAMVGGRDLLDAPFELRDRDLTGIVVTWTDWPGGITGRFEDASGQPLADFYVVVFPADETMWLPGSRRFASTRPGTDGRFSLTPLPSGDYRMVALTDFEPGDLDDRMRLRSLLPESIAVAVHDGEITEQDIRAAE